MTVIDAIRAHALSAAENNETLADTIEKAMRWAISHHSSIVWETLNGVIADLENGNAEPQDLLENLSDCRNLLEE